MGQQGVSYCFVKPCWLPMPKMWLFSQFFPPMNLLFLIQLVLFKRYFHDLSKFPKMKSKKPRWFSCALKTLVSVTSWKNGAFYSSYLSHHPVVFLWVFSISADTGNTCYMLLAVPGAEVPQSLWSSSSMQNVNYFTISGFKLVPS